MKTNLTARAVVIVVTILVCIYGIIGVPKSKAELMDHLQNNIRLGLDLRGGSHLVLEVQVQDAVKADAEQTMERLQQDVKKQNISYTSMEVSNLPDVSTTSDAERISLTIKGIPITSASAFRDFVAQRYSNYILTALNATDYSMKMKPSDLIALKRDTVQRTMDTISNRINGLGLAESSVQQYGR